MMKLAASVDFQCFALRSCMCFSCRCWICKDISLVFIYLLFSFAAFVKEFAYTLFNIIGSIKKRKNIKHIS